MDDFLTLAEWWFDLDDSTQAEVFVNRTKHIVHNVSDRFLQLRYKQANVKLADSKREFLLAAQGYYNLALEEGLDADEYQNLYNSAVVCTILAPSGARKARCLALLLKDERCKMNPFYQLLSKMALGRVIRSQDSKEFES